MLAECGSGIGRVEERLASLLEAQGGSEYARYLIDSEVSGALRRLQVVRGAIDAGRARGLAAALVAQVEEGPLIGCSRGKRAEVFYWAARLLAGQSDSQAEAERLLKLCSKLLPERDVAVVEALLAE